MQVDQKKALRLLEEEVAAAKEGETSPAWLERIRELEAACGTTNLTFFAALGTALLAKATNLDVDVFSLKAKTGADGYSARNLCKEVLAANAPRLGVDLGVTGREPLNNQPFYAEDKISAGLPIRAGARPALDALLRCLGEAALLRNERDARLALRTFIFARKWDRSAWVLDETEGIEATVDGLATAIDKFVREQSEHGKRAQGVVAGLLDVTFGEEGVVTGRIHDPSRHFPGDVAVHVGAVPQKGIGWVFEVRDKPVTSRDVEHFAVAVLEGEIPHAGVVAVAVGQSLEDLDEGVRWAAERGLLVMVYASWADFVRDVLFWSPYPIRDAVGMAYRRVFVRMEELEVSGAGMASWNALGKRRT